MIPPPRFRFSISGLVLAWGLIVSFGLFSVGVYTAVPGEAGSPPALWPDDIEIRRDLRRSTLLIFLHPGCPCSQASVAELGIILSQTARHVNGHAVLLSAKHSDMDWVRSPLKAALALLPEVRQWEDRSGGLAHRFRVATSGHVVLYDQNGRLTYSGGITDARGHQGDNPGRAAVIGLILGKTRQPSSRSVFGCPLLASEPAPDGEPRR